MSQNINVKFTANAKALEKQIKNVQKQLDGTSRSVKKCKNEFKGLTDNMNKNKKAAGGLNTDLNRATGNFNKLSKSLSIVSKASAAAFLAYNLAPMIQSSLDAIEVTNMFEVSMRELTEETDRFLQKYSNLTGLDIYTLREATGTFNLIAKSMGLASETSQRLGLNATQLAIDMASIFNVPIKQAMEDMRSGLVGQTEVLYKYGIDITEASLQTEAYRLGLDKSVRTMTQGEKMFLRMSVAMKQASDYSGDFARTIASPANQLKILSERLISLGRAIGNVFIPILTTVLPYINAVVIVLTKLFTILASIFGFVEKKPSNSTGIGGAFEGVGDSAEDSGEKVEKLKQEIKDVTLGFDELHAISQTTPTTPDGGGDGLEDQGILMPELDEYNSKLEQIRDKASEIAKKILEWLGFTVDVDEETGEWNLKLKEGYTILELIRDILFIIAAISLYNKFQALLPIFEKLAWHAKTIYLNLKEFGFLRTLQAFTGITPTMLAIGVAATHFYNLYQNSENFRKTLESVKTVISGVAKIIYDDVLAPMGEAFLTIGKGLLDLLPEDVKEAILKFCKEFKEALDNIEFVFTDIITLVAGLVLLFNPATMLAGIALLGFEIATLAARAYGGKDQSELDSDAQSAIDKFQEFVNTVQTQEPIVNDNFDSMNNAQAKFFEDMTLGALENSTAFGDSMESMNNDQAKFFEDFTMKSLENSTAVNDDYASMETSLGELFSNGLTSLETWFTNIKTKVSTFYTDNIQPWFSLETWGNLAKNIKDGISGKWDEFVNWWKTTGIYNWWEDDVKPWFTLEKWSELFNNAKKGFGEGWNKLKEEWKEKFGKWWDEDVKVLFTKQYWLDLLGDVKKGASEGFKNVVNAIIGLFEKFLNFCIDAINDFLSIEIDGKRLGVTIPHVELDRIGGAARGGMLQGGQLFIAGEYGKAEMVGNYNGKTTVMPLENTDFVKSMYDAVYSAVVQGQSGGTQNIENILYLDGEVVYKSYNKTSKKKGVNFNLGEFAR